MHTLIYFGLELTIWAIYIALKSFKLFLKQNEVDQIK